MLVEDRQEALLDLGEGLVPADLDEDAVPLDQRAAQPVRVLVELLQGRALRADVAVAEHVVAVAADADDLLAVGVGRSVISSPQLASQSGQVR